VINKGIKGRKLNPPKNVFQKSHISLTKLAWRLRSCKGRRWLCRQGGGKELGTAVLLQSAPENKIVVVVVVIDVSCRKAIMLCH
jgi:hypothetical protein